MFRRTFGCYKPPKKRDDVYVDPLSIQHCLTCTLPVEECRGAPSVRGKRINRQATCPYEQAVAEAQTKCLVTLPGPRPDGVMRTWKCEVGIWQEDAL